MDKRSTQTLGYQAQKTSEGRRAIQPKASTIAFLRQFARAYCPAPNASLPGIVLN